MAHPRTVPLFCLLCDTAKFDFFRFREYSTKTGERFTFDEVYGRKRIIEVEDFAVYPPCIADLVRIKRVRNAPKDQEDIKYLQVLLRGPRRAPRRARRRHRTRAKDGTP